MADSLGVEAATRFLLDARADTRQRAAVTIAQRTASLFREHPAEEAYRVLQSERDRIAHLFINTIPAAHRRAGLVAVRAIVGGIPVRVHPEGVVVGYTTLITNSFADVDPLVRAAAVEAAHEAVRAFGEQSLQFCMFDVFTAMAAAATDSDAAVLALERELRMTLREVAGHGAGGCLNAPGFLDALCDVLGPFSQLVRFGGSIADADYATVTSRPAAVAWGLDWLRFALDSPGVVSVSLLPQALPILVGVAAMSEMKASEGVAHVEPLRILESFRSELHGARIASATVSSIAVQALSVLVSAVSLQQPGEEQGTRFGTNPDVTRRTPTHLLRFCLDWVRELTHTATTLEDGSRMRRAVLGMCDSILPSILPHLSSTDTATRSVAKEANEELGQLLCSATPIELEDGAWAAVINALCTFFASDESSATVPDETCLAGLRWVAAAHRGDPGSVEDHYTELCAFVSNMLCGTSLVVSRAAAEVLVTLNRGDVAKLETTVRGIFTLVGLRPASMLARLPGVLRAMQAATDTCQCPDVNAHEKRPNVLVVSAEILASLAEQDKQDTGVVLDLRTVGKCVVALHAVLLTADEFGGLRTLLRGTHQCGQESACAAAENATPAAVFASMCCGWKYNAVAMLSLCLLASQDAMAFEVAACMGERELSASTMVQLERFVQLLEGPAFTHTRMRLLRPVLCPWLVKTLYAVLMLLPQVSPHFETLYRRLLLLPGLHRADVATTDTAGAPPVATQQCRVLLDQFVSAQDDMLASEVDAATAVDG